MDIRRMFTYDYNSKSDSGTQHVIMYTSSDDNIVTPSYTNVFGANIINNVYIDGVGYLTFDGPVTTIGDYAFLSTSLTSITIPDSVTSIGSCAFEECDSLTIITIPASVASIGNSAFEGCTGLTSITIPEGVTSISGYAFYECESLESIIIPNSVTSIGEHAFGYCYNLTSINIPDSVISIGEWAFDSCESLTSVTIPDSVTTIGNLAFAYCYSLTSVTIGNSVTEIGNSAFLYCSSLTSVYCKATRPPALGGSSVFDSNGGGRMIYVPASSVNRYRNATNWSEYKPYIIGYNF